MSGVRILAHGARALPKDVVRWFEGAKWKQASDWHDSALWILDIVEAGASRRLERLESGFRITQCKKGSPAAFITPIIHCLNDALPVINSKVVKTYADVAAALGVRDEISASRQSSIPDNLPASCAAWSSKLKPLGLGESH